MPFIGLQAGHQNIENNIDPQLRPETGAAGEMEFNVNVRNALSEVLQSYGFQVQLDDANANSKPNTIGVDFDFYLAIHAEGAPAGGIASAPDPSVDASNDESKRIISAINNVYFSDTGIERNDQIITNNMTFYYMWNVLTAKTPCGIIECGDLADPHDSVILADARRVALGIAHGLCDAFNVAWKGDPQSTPEPTPTPADPCADLQKEFDAYRLAHPAIVVTSNSTNGSTIIEVPKIAGQSGVLTGQEKKGILQQLGQELSQVLGKYIS